MGKLVALTLIFALLALLAAACGGGGGAPTTAPSVTATAEAPTVGVRPAAGAFQLVQVGTFQLLLIVFEEGSDVIDFITLACMPEGVIAGLPSTIAADLEIEEGKFSAESDEILIDGRFMSPTTAEGTIRALTEDARDCGVPDEGRWMAECNLSAEPYGDGGFQLEEPTGPCAQSPPEGRGS